jgi:response regulator of citrate/malate metabolism
LDTNTIHLLLVDDDAEYASIAQHYLRSFHNKNFALTWVSDGDAAAKHLAAHPETELILMDYYLPTKTGIEIIKDLFERKNTVPIILLTSNKDFRVAIEAMKYGVEDYLLKEEMVETMLPRAIVSVLDRVNLKKRIGESEERKHASEAIQELIVTMCHEFNNPLAAIKISTDILARHQGPPEERELLTKLNANISLLEKQIIKLRDITSQQKG